MEPALQVNFNVRPVVVSRVDGDAMVITIAVIDLMNPAAVSNLITLFEDNN